jgi:hypothetical protein
MNHILDATSAILRAARRNHNITAAGLLDECERGDFDGWLSVGNIRQLNASQISAALTIAADELKRIDATKAKAA